MQDYLDVTDGLFDAISSIGMYQHVGAIGLGEYVDDLYGLLAPRGRLLNHAITRPTSGRSRIDPRGFIGRYVFPDGELFEVGELVTALQRPGLEVRHVEGLRERYAATLRAWLANVEENWAGAVRHLGTRRARLWRLYLAGCAVAFDGGAIGVHQVLAVKPDARGVTGMPGRPAW